MSLGLRGRAVVLVLAVALGTAVAACGSQPTPSVVATGSPSVAPSSTPRSVPPSGSPTVTQIDVHPIAQQYTTPMLDAQTDGHEIVWSTGAANASAGAAPDLYRYVPDGPPPAPAFQNPHRDSLLETIAVRNGHYAFVEANRALYGVGGWRVWFLPGAGLKPVAVDTSDGPGGATSPVPFLALTDDQLVWTAVHKTSTGLRYQLRSYSIGSRTTRDLQSSNPARAEYWFPFASADGRLVYGTVEHSGTSDEAFHVYLFDLGATGTTPRRLDDTGRAAMPVISGDTVVWKQTSGNVFNWGVLVRRSLGQAATTPITFEAQVGLNYPSVGNRFLAAWGEDDTDFEIFDLAKNTPLLIERYKPTAPQGVVRPVVAGDLLIFIRGSTDPSRSDLQLCWAWLPSRG